MFLQSSLSVDPRVSSSVRRWKDSPSCLFLLHNAVSGDDNWDGSGRIQDKGRLTGGLTTGGTKGIWTSLLECHGDHRLSCTRGTEIPEIDVQGIGFKRAIVVRLLNNRSSCVSKCGLIETGTAGVSHSDSCRNRLTEDMARDMKVI